MEYFAYKLLKQYSRKNINKIRSTKYGKANVREKKKILFSRDNMRDGKTRKRMESGWGDVCSTVNGIWAEGGSQVVGGAALVSQSALDR